MRVHFDLKIENYFLKIRMKCALRGQSRVTYITHDEGFVRYPT